ncbi:hypothetical protein NQ318_014561, partial [Aromia moschata]
MHKITILQMIGYGDRTRTQAEVVRLFQEKYPELRPISQGTRNSFGNVDMYGSSRKNPPNKRSDDQKLDVMLMLEENPHTSSRQTASTLNINHSSILRVLTKNQMHPYKLHIFTFNLNGETYLTLLQNNVPTMGNLYPVEGNPQLPGQLLENNSTENIQNNVTRHLRGISKAEFSSMFQELYERSKLCVARGGDYRWLIKNKEKLVWSVLFLTLYAILYFSNISLLLHLLQ